MDSFKYLYFIFGGTKAQRLGHFETMSGGTPNSWPMTSAIHYHKRTLRYTIMGPCKVRHMGQGIPFLALACAMHSMFCSLGKTIAAKHV